MRRLAAVALTAGLMALPVCAQRPESHSGSANHFSAAPHGGFHAATPRAFSAPPQRSFNGPTTYRQAVLPHGALNRPVTVARDGRGGGNGNRGARNGLDRGHHRRPYISPFRTGIIYTPGYGVPGYPLDYPESTGADDTAAVQGQSYADGYDAQPEEAWQPPAPSAYPPLPAQANPPPEREEAVTLIFKDGRPSEQIHNYILTRSTLFVGDGQHREIPTDQLDLVATAKANQDAGVDFRLPSVPK